MDQKEFYKGKIMSKSFVGELILDAEFVTKCEYCGKEFDWNLEDGYFYLPNGRLKIRCPHCRGDYYVNVKLTKVMEDQ